MFKNYTTKQLCGFQWNSHTLNTVYLNKRWNLSGHQPCQCWIKNQRFGDVLSLRHQGRCGEWPYVADIYSQTGVTHPTLTNLSSCCLTCPRRQTICVLFSMLFSVSGDFRDVCMLEWCWDCMLCWVWTLSLCLYCPDVILFCCFFDKSHVAWRSS
jgi:hypothetical protein